MKIAYLTFNTRPNGGNKIVLEHISRLKKKGYNIELYSVFGRPKNIFSLFASYPDILVTTFWPTAYLGTLIPAKRKIYFVQAWEEEFYSNVVLSKLALFSHVFPYEKIVISNYIYRKIQSNFENSKRIYKIPCPIDTTIFHSLKERKINKSPIILSVVSWYKWYKGPDLLVQVVRNIKEQHPNYRFILASNEKNKLDQVFDEFNSNPSPSKLAKLYRKADIFLTTSRSEGFPLPPLEAMSSGCIVISTNSKGILEYGKNGSNCLIAQPHSKIWKEDIIARVLANKKLRKKLITNGIKTARTYRWENVIGQLEKIYNI